jgi:hypothetical protein
MLGTLGRYPQIKQPSGGHAITAASPTLGLQPFASSPYSYIKRFADRIGQAH